MFRGAGFAVSRRTQDGEVSVELRTEASAAVLEAADRREWRSEARSLRPLLYPESVAVVGVRREAGGLGRAVLDAIRAAGFAGRLYVVHPEADAVAGLPGVPHASPSIGEPVDLVVIVVPADHVAEVMADACAAGVGAAIVVSSGLRRPGPARAERELLRAGPRATACAWSDPTRRACCRGARESGSTPRSPGPCRSPAGWRSPRSRAASASRCSTWPGDLGVGVHSFVSLGAKLDVSSNDLLAAWMDDDQVLAAAPLSRVVRQRA